MAEQIDDAVQADASDGFILIPHLVPGGLDEFVDEVSRSCRTAAPTARRTPGPTLRDHLGLRRPTTARVDTPQSA